MLFGKFNCPSMGSFCSYSHDDSITEVLEHLSEFAGYDLVAENVEWFTGIPKKLKPVKYQFQD